MKSEDYMQDIKMRFNSEKKMWVQGILVWAICFLAIQIMMTFFPWLRYAGIVLNGIIIFVVYFGLRNLNKEIKKLKEVINGK